MSDSLKDKAAIRGIRLRKELDRDLREFLMQLVQMEDIPHRIARTALKLHERVTPKEGIQGR